MTMRMIGLGVGFTALIGCATTSPGARPHDMSASGHEAAAAQHENTADTHAYQYRPSASVAEERCRPTGGPGAGADGVSSDVCWSSVTNPSDAHLAAAQEHRREAADHRAASAALREAEGRACVGIAVDDRDMCPFGHMDDIASVTPLTEEQRGARTSTRRTTGATVTFRAVPGMTAEWLQRVVDCHLARVAVLGHDAPEMPNCPLEPNGAEAHVSSTGNGFAVAIRANDPTAGADILARAQHLASHNPTAAR